MGKKQEQRNGGESEYKHKDNGGSLIESAFIKNLYKYLLLLKEVRNGKY